MSALSEHLLVLIPVPGNDIMVGKFFNLICIYSLFFFSKVNKQEQLSLFRSALCSYGSVCGAGLCHC